MSTDPYYPDGVLIDPSGEPKADVAEPQVAADTWTDRWGQSRMVLAGNVPYLYEGCQTLDEKALAGRVLELRGQRDELAERVQELEAIGGQLGEAVHKLDGIHPKRIAALEETNRELADALEAIRARIAKQEEAEDDGLQWIDDCALAVLRKAGRA